MKKTDACMIVASPRYLKGRTFCHAASEAANALTGYLQFNTSASTKAN